MSLEEFSKQRTTTALPSTGGSSMIESFQKQQTSRIQQPVVSEKELKAREIYTGGVVASRKAKTGWNWLMKQLNKPVGAIAAETEALGLAIGEGKLKDYKPGKATLDVLTGKEENSFTELWLKYGEDAGINPNVSLAIGLTSDIVIDPLNFFGGGLTKKGQLAKRVTSILDAGQEVTKGSKLAKEYAFNSTREKQQQFQKETDRSDSGWEY